MKTVLSIQDLSCVGRCSLTVALPVLSAMGCQCSVLPTAVLSTHTGFPDPKVVSLTEHLAGFDRHWQSLGLSFDAVAVGYLANASQAQALLPLLSRYKAQGSTLVLDPAMGDHGRLYSGLAQDHALAVAKLCKEADILVPNLTEAALLTDIPYQEQADQKYLSSLLRELVGRYGVRGAVITGVSEKDTMTGFWGISDGEIFSYETPLIPRRCHGTGDLFTAVLTGGLLRGLSLYESGVLAADFVRLCVSGTPSVSPHGVEFETQLSFLYHYASSGRF